MQEPLMKISEIAAFYKISAKTMRLYEKKGLLCPAKVDPDTGYRYYAADQLQALNAILEMKQLGFSLAEIKSILDGNVDRDALITALARKSLAWQDAIAVAQDKIDAIDTITENLAKSDSAAKLLALSEEERAWLLCKLVCIEDLGGRRVLSEALWL